MPAGRRRRTRPPRGRTARQLRTSTISRSVRAAKSRAPLRRRRHEPAADVMQQRLSESGAGRNQRDVAAAERDALLQRVHFRFGRTGTDHAIAFEIVDQPEAAESDVERRAARRRARHVGQRGSFVDHGSSDAEARVLTPVAEPRSLSGTTRSSSQIVVVERAERGTKTGCGRTGAESNKPSSVLVRDVASEQHKQLSLERRDLS